MPPDIPLVPLILFPVQKWQGPFLVYLIIVHLSSLRLSSVGAEILAVSLGHIIVLE